MHGDLFNNLDIDENTRNMFSRFFLKAENDLLTLSAKEPACSKFSKFE